ncbi:hypothetical protein CI238_10152 [Colletotrichum incanum]|uniref:Uncharacterized protein n=1 Tax=Colletotrichum incanum TaxID=1573173 RepID=A0A162N7U1_COLIC|nr:hypothetical protein CI238_10152 [Colletotrichum incanum]
MFSDHFTLLGAASAAGLVFIAMSCRQRSARVRNRLPVVVSLPISLSAHLSLICVSPRTCPICQENRSKGTRKTGNTCYIIGLPIRRILIAMSKSPLSTDF